MNTSNLIMTIKINGLMLLVIVLFTCEGKKTLTLENTERYKGYSSYENGYKYDLHMLMNYQEGLDCARKSNLPIFLQFTGHGCVGYDPFIHDLVESKKIRKVLNDNFVTVILYVDDRRELENINQIYELGLSDKAIKKIENRKFIGTLNAAIQIDKFKLNAQPLYILMDNEENEIIKPFGYTRNIQMFLDKLNEGLGKYNGT